MLGYHVPTTAGADVVDLPTDFATSGPGGKVVSHPLFAVTVLQPCDEIASADGHVLKQPGDLSKIVQSRRVGTFVTLGIVRNGKPMTVRIRVVDDAGKHIIGVGLALRYSVPVRIDINTSDISGPSAGLAMALAVVDALTPGELTGGKRVAVTGTIDPTGQVGEIGGLPQKAVAARAAHAQIFIVPVCVSGPTQPGCEKDLATARKRIGKNVELVPVSTLAQALKVLRDAGGGPVTTSTTG